MTDTQEAMRQLEQFIKEHPNYTLLELWQAATTQSTEKIARLEAEVEKERKFHIMEQEMRIAEERKLTAAELSNKQLKEVLYAASVGFHQSDIRMKIDAALAQPISIEALDAYVAKLTKWQPIETAPKDGTTIDVWFDEVGRTTVYWGLPHHSCGEMGQYCDSDWHGDTEEGWIDALLNFKFGGKNFTHWMPLPPAPEKE